MKKILVTTDFSANSKAAMRFAVQLASQADVALTFLHVQHILRMTTWNESAYVSYETGEIARLNEALTDFVHSVCKPLKTTPKNYQCVVENSPFTDSTIRDYAADHGFDYICISTHGAGMMETLFGSTASNLINQSSVPVIAVPTTYRTSQLSTVLYLSDLSRLDEVKRVVDFARPLAAAVELLHIKEFYESTIDPAIIGAAVQKQTDYPVAVQVKPRDMANALTGDIDTAINAHKPSVLVMFTTQTDGFLARLMGTGNSVDYAFLTTVPLLVFRKA